MQAVNKLLNGTTNVTYYSDDIVENYMEYEGSRKAVNTYFQKTYPNYTIGYDWETGYAYAEKYVSDWTITWG